MSEPKTILIVEDDKALLRALKLKLEHEGFMIEIAPSGKECIELCASRRFDLVLLDLVMPIMDGFETLERLQQLPQQPMVLVLTNLSEPKFKKQTMALGAKKFIVKSDTSLNQIVEEIKQTLSPESIE